MESAALGMVDNGTTSENHVQTVFLGHAALLFQQTTNMSSAALTQNSARASTKNPPAQPGPAMQQTRTWVKSKNPLHLTVDLVKRKLSMRLGAIDLVGGSNLMYQFVPAEATGTLPVLVLTKINPTVWEPRFMVFKLSSPQDSPALEHSLKVLSATLLADQKQQGKHGTQPEALTPAQEAGCSAHQLVNDVSAVVPSDACKEDTNIAGPANPSADQTRRLIQAYLLDPDFQEYVRHVEEVWDDLERELQDDVEAATSHMDLDDELG